MTILECKNLGIQFGGLKAVDNFNLQVKKGGLYGLIGPNGAGKTTVFNLLTGVYRPTSGSIKLEEKLINGLSPASICEAGIARTFQNIRLFSRMRVIDNVKSALHRRSGYSLFSSLFYTPPFRKRERALDTMALDILSEFDLDKVAF